MDFGSQITKLQDAPSNINQEAITQFLAVDKSPNDPAQ
jgi:hypothetical protein